MHVVMKQTRQMTQEKHSGRLVRGGKDIQLQAAKPTTPLWCDCDVLKQIMSPGA